MLHRGRTGLEGIAKREAAGESLWTTAFDHSIRVKLHYAFADPFRFSAGPELPIINDADARGTPAAASERHQFA
jgi:hypothetical protein